MKWRINSCKSAMAAGLLVALVMALPAAAAPAAQPVAPEVVSRSVFITPANPREGRDPFFPDSNRPYENMQPTNQVHEPHIGDITALVLKGISGPSDHRLAIINNHTFGVGDEQDLTTPQGRIHIRLVEIKDNSVMIESAGERYELKYASNP
jgi:hypothetical protein